MKKLFMPSTHILSSAFLLSALCACMNSAYACSPPKSHFKNVSCTPVVGVFIAAKDDGAPVAILDRQGAETAKLFDYQAVLGSEYRGGLLPVNKGGKVGYINHQGRIIIRPQYDRMPMGNWARGVYERRIIVHQNGGFGVLDNTGKAVLKIDRSIQNITDFKDGVATVTKARETYEIDLNGQRIRNSSAVTTATPAAQVAQAPTPASSVNKNTPASPAISNRQPKFTPRSQDGKWGFVDHRGVVMILYVFDEVRDYSEGLAAVRQGDRWGFIDYAGDLMIDFRFDKNGFMRPGTPSTPAEPLRFENGRAWIGNLNNDTKMCINTQGQPISC